MVQGSSEEVETAKIFEAWKTISACTARADWLNLTEPRPIQEMCGRRGQRHVAESISQVSWSLGNAPSTHSTNTKIPRCRAKPRSRSLNTSCFLSYSSAAILPIPVPSHPSTPKLRPSSHSRLSIDAAMHSLTFATLPLLLAVLAPWGSSSSFAAAALPKCYFPNGNEIHSTNLSTTYEPCNDLVGATSQCCATDQGCSANGLCISKQNWYSRGGCTDPTFQSPFCVAICTSILVCRWDLSACEGTKRLTA
jgi:hypothetical protein